VRLTSSSLMRRSRVMSRGEPGVRRKPRALRAFESASMLTVRSGTPASSSRATARSSSCGAVWASPAPAAAPPTAPVRLPGPRLLGRRLDARTRERAEREPAEAYPQAGRHVAHRVERLVVGDDLEQVARPRL